MVARGTWITVAVIALTCSAVFGVFTAWLDNLEAEGSLPPRFVWLQNEIPPYPNAFFFPMGQEMHTNGIPREMGYALTRDSPRKVADRYEAVWTDEGQRVERHRDGDQETLIATDRADPIIRTIIVSQKPSGQTVIIASVTEKFRFAGERLIPVPGDCSVITSNGARDDAVITEMALLRCPRKLAQVVAHFDGQLQGSSREVLIQPTIDRKQMQIEYENATTNVRILLNQDQDQPPSTVINVTWQEQP